MDIDGDLTARTDHSYEVHVVGGGLGGLAAAAFIARAGHSVVVHEQRGRVGGRATTDQRDGYRFNQGPHAWYLGGEGAGVVAELGIRLTGSAPAQKGSMMARAGELHLAPGGVGSLLRTSLLGVGDKAELARVLQRVSKIESADLASIAVDDWIHGSTGRQRVAEVMQAIVRLSTYVNDPGRLSAEVAALQVQRALSSGVLCLDQGWDQLVGKLRTVVIDAGGAIDTSTVVTELPDAAAVVVAVGGPAATAAIVGEQFTTGPASTASCLDLTLRRPARHRFVIGVDEPMYLSDHGRPDGMTPPGGSSLAVATYLAPGDEPDRATMQAFAGRAGIATDDVVAERYLHRMTTVTAIATAEHGGLAGRPSARGRHSSRHVRGGGLGRLPRPSRRRGPRERPTGGPGRSVAPRSHVGGAVTEPLIATGVEQADVERFESQRPRLRGLAYRMTGTPDDADDVVQEAWLRWQRADRSAIDNAAAWLTTVTTRISIDRMTSARVRREQYVGPWVPEPIEETSIDPSDLAAAADSLTLGFLRVLETLEPIERAVFLLHDVFGYPFADIAATVDRSASATRQIGKRARDRVRDGRPRVTTEPADIVALSDAFLAAMFEGDIDRLASMLTEDVVHLSDGGPDHRAARRPVRGPRQVARLFVNLTRTRLLPGDDFHRVTVNGQPGSYVVRDGEPFLLTVLGWRGDTGRRGDFDRQSGQTPGVPRRLAGAIAQRSRNRADRAIGSGKTHR